MLRGGGSSIHISEHVAWGKGLRRGCLERRLHKESFTRTVFKNCNFKEYKKEKSNLGKENSNVHSYFGVEPTRIHGRGGICTSHKLVLLKNKSHNLQTVLLTIK